MLRYIKKYSEGCSRVFLKPYDKILKEFENDPNKEYLGDVEDNNDPLKLGRLKIRIDLYEDMETNQLPWSAPQTSLFLGNSENTGMLSVPIVGSQVKVFFPTKDIDHPFYKGADLTNNNKTTFFEEDYPNTYGFKDDIGNFFKVNKTQKTLLIQHYTSSNILFDGDKIVITHADGAVFELLPGNKIKMSTELLEVQATNTNISGNLSVGTGATGTITSGSTTTVSNGIVTNIT